MSTACCFMVYACVLLIGVQVPLSLQETTQATETTTASSTEVTTEDSAPNTSTTSDATISDQSTTEQSSTTITAAIPEISCYSGSCYGNVSDENDVSCINTTISEKCMLSGEDKCFQTVFKNSSNIVFEVGCKTNCEYLVQEGEGTESTATTRCCDTDLCNKERLPDPHSGNAAVSVTSSISMTSCLVVLFLMI